MRLQPVLERTVVAKIMAAMKEVPRLVVRKRHGTAMGVAGDPDLYGTINGRHFEIEVKRPNDPASQLTKLQTERLLDWKVAGALTGVARSVEEAFIILGLAQPERVWVCTGCWNYRWQSADPPARCPVCGHLHFEQERIG